MDKFNVKIRYFLDAKLAEFIQILSLFGKTCKKTQLAARSRDFSRNGTSPCEFWESSFGVMVLQRLGSVNWVGVGSLEQRRQKDTQQRPRAEFWVLGFFLNAHFRGFSAQV